MIEENLKEKDIKLINYYLHHSYTYNKWYNAIWRGFALQLSPCKSIGNKELKGGYK